MIVKKLILLLCTIMVITPLSACKDINNMDDSAAYENVVTNDASNNASNDASNDASDEEADETTENEFEYIVPNTSNKFSNKDLIYFIMVDRFFDGDTENNDFNDTNPDDPKSYQGGDLKGVIEKLPYIKSLGATTIWITPIVKNEPFGYHGYWTEDFYAVDPHFGDMETLKALVTEAHNLDMKIILDYVVNHTGYQHEWTKDVEKTDWFHHNGTITNFRDKNQVENFSLAGLPDLNQDNPEVKSYFFENVLWWIRETDIDGMRLDTVRHVPKEFWNEFTYLIKQEYPDFYLLGEVWINSQSYLESYHELGIDGLANFPLYEGIKDTFQLYGKATELKIAINNDQKFSNPEINGIFIDNHDTARLISRTSKFKEEYLKLSLSFIMTYPSIPIVYYGTEIGLEGKEDPDNRRFMEWDELENPDNEIYPYYKTLVDLRKEINDMNLDTFNLLTANPNYISYERISDTNSIVVILNVSNNPQSVLLETLSSSGTYRDYLTGDILELSTEQEINIEPFTSRILIKTED